MPWPRCAPDWSRRNSTPGRLHPMIRAAEEQRDGESQRAFDSLCKVLEPGKTKLLIGKIFPFDQVHQALEHRCHGPTDKVLVGPIGE